MTEAGWLAATDPDPMLRLLNGKASDRKLILLMVSLLRECQQEPGRSREVSIRYEVAERYAEGRVPVANVRAVWGGQPSLVETPYDWVDELLLHAGTGVLLYDTPSRSEISRRLREVFGNPFRPVVVDPSWATSDVLALAEGIYQDRAFDRMPILADTLQDAGCDNDDTLTHCRQAAEHVRGCWVIDLLLGKG